MFSECMNNVIFDKMTAIFRTLKKNCYLYEKHAFRIYNDSVFL